MSFCCLFVFLYIYAKQGQKQLVWRLFEIEQSCEILVKDNRGNFLVCQFEKQKLRKQRIVPIVSIVFKTSLLF